MIGFRQSTIGGKWESIRESIFSLFYIMTEQNEQMQGTSSFRVLRRILMYFLDLGQVLRAIFRPEFGWGSKVVGSINNLDFVGFVVNMVNISLDISTQTVYSLLCAGVWQVPQGGGSPQLYYHDCSGRIPGHTTRAPPVGFNWRPTASIRIFHNIFIFW